MVGQGSIDTLPCCTTTFPNFTESELPLGRTRLTCTGASVQNGVVHSFNQFRTSSALNLHITSRYTQWYRSHSSFNLPLHVLLTFPCAHIYTHSHIHTAHSMPLLIPPVQVHLYSGSKNCPNVWLFWSDWLISQQPCDIIFQNKKKKKKLCHSTSSWLGYQPCIM